MSEANTSVSDNAKEQTIGTLKEAIQYIGSGGVVSVNGKTGVVNLTASDVGALPSSTVIPTVNNGTLTIQKNGSTVQTFGANDSQNRTANITVPTKTSQLSNDSEFVTETEAEAAASSAVATHNAATDAHSDLFDAKLNVTDQAVKKTATTGVISAKQTDGYASTEYSLLTGLYDGQDDHDAATVGQLEIVSDAVALRAKKITLYSDGNEIYSDPEMTAVMTYAQIKALVDDTNNIVVIDNGNYELRYQYENAQGTENAIWFNANTMLSGKPYLYRIIINSNNQVLNDEIEVAKAIDGTFTGTTNAENIVVSGDLTCDGDTSIANGTVSGELDVPTPTTDNQAANKAYVDTADAKKQDKLTAGDNITITDNTISATDTTYSAFTGATSETAGLAGLVPAPQTTDTDKFLKGDGTWGEAGGGSSVNVVQTTGTSTTDVMSQKATTDMVFSDNDTSKIVIGSSYAPSNNGIYIGSPNTGWSGGRYAVCIGNNAGCGANDGVAIGGGALIASSGISAVNINGNQCNSVGAVAVGDAANVGSNRPYSVSLGSSANMGSGCSYAVSLGAYSTTSAQGEVSLGGTALGTNGYNGTQYRLLTNVYDGQSDHDAVTVEQVNATIDAINTALSTSIPHIGASS